MVDVYAAREQKLILENRRVTIRDLSAALKLSIGNAHISVHEELEYYNVYARWVPKWLKKEHKNRRLETDHSHLQQVEKQAKQFLLFSVTNNET
jgi:hypothetical protein